MEIPTLRVFNSLLAPARYKGAYGGRGSAKSWFFAGMVVEHCIRFPAFRIVCLREVQKTLKESVKLLIEDLIQRYGAGYYFRVLKESIETRGGGMILFQGMQDHTAESIKSLEGFDVGYFEEAQTCTKRSLELLRPTIRRSKYLDSSELWFSWNPRHATDPVDLFFRGPTPPKDAVIVRTNWRDNKKWFPKELEKEREHDERTNPERYAHIWDGEYEPQAVGALWSRMTIHRNRRDEAPDFKRILVAVDPPTSAEENANEAGIVVGGLGVDGRGYVIDDVSMRGLPQQWGEKAIAAYELYEADAIVAEVNQGGDMVKHVIHSMRPSVRVIAVRATRGAASAHARSTPPGRRIGGRAKAVRAEPISSLYDLDRISHVGAFPELEGQMCLMTPDGYHGDGSPDRVDALVYLFTELFPKMIRRQRPKDRPLPTRANSMYNPHRMRQAPTVVRRFR